MNIRLVCHADSKKRRGSYVILKDGKAEVKESFSIADKGSEATLKEYTFESLIRGLRNVRGYVSHDDLLLIELYNAHIVEWLNGSKEYKGYNKYLDEVSDIIDTLDCRYLFTKSGVKEAKNIIDKKNETVLQGIGSAFDGMI